MVLEFLTAFGVNLAFLLLFFPPLLFYMLPRFSDQVYRLLLLAAPLGAVLLIVMMRTSAFVFIGYLLTFYLLFYYARKAAMLDMRHSFAISLYAVFAISVLWEFPIQIGIPQNPDALLLSIFKGLGIPFFFLTIYRLGWRPSLGFVQAVAIIVTVGLFYGLALAFQYQTYPIIDDKVQFTPLLIWSTHLFRIPWFLVLVSALNRITLNKERTTN